MDRVRAGIAFIVCDLWNHIHAKSYFYKHEKRSLNDPEQKLVTKRKGKDKKNKTSDSGKPNFIGNEILLGFEQ